MPTIDKQTFARSLTGKTLDAAELQRAHPGLDTSSVAQNGKIEGTAANVEKLWKLIDDFDRDGNRNTVSDAKAISIASWVMSRAGGGVVPGVGTLPPSTGTKWEKLALAGHESILAAVKLHNDAIKDTGIGRFYGDHSSFKNLVQQSDRQGVKDYVENATGGKWTFKDFGPRMAVIIRSTTTGAQATIEQQSCVGWQMKHSRAAHEAAGMGGRFAEINTRMREVQMLGTIHCEELQKDGWTALFCSAPSAAELQGNAGYLGALNMALRKAPLYKAGGVSGSKGIVPDDVIVGYRDSTPSAKTQAQLDALAQVPFAVGVAKGGVHTYVVHEGKVSEVHWDRDPTDTSIVEETPVDKWQWDQLVIMVPPKLYKKPAPTPDV